MDLQLACTQHMFLFADKQAGKLGRGFPSFSARAEVKNCATKSESKHRDSNLLNLLQVLKYIASSSLVTFATQHELS